jgi:hypothetical protein
VSQKKSETVQERPQVRLAGSRQTFIGRPLAWWLDCFDAAGKREPSDIERAAALASIKLAHGRMAEVLGTYEAKGRK